MMLTLADMGKKNMKIYGGPGIKDWMFSLRHFMRRSDVTATVTEWRMPSVCFPQPISLPPIVHADVTIVPIPLYSLPLAGEASPAQVLETLKQEFLHIYQDHSLAPFQGRPVHTILSHTREEALLVGANETPSARYVPPKASPQNGSKGETAKPKEETSPGLSSAAPGFSHQRIGLPAPFAPMHIHSEPCISAAGEVSVTHASSGSPSAPHSLHTPYSPALPSVLYLSPGLYSPFSPGLSTGSPTESQAIGSPNEGSTTMEALTMESPLETPRGSSMDSPPAQPELPPLSHPLHLSPSVSPTASIIASLVATPEPTAAPFSSTAYDAATSYLVLSHSVPGKFHPDKARALGVKPGPLFGKLSRGIAIDLEVEVEKEDGTKEKQKVMKRINPEDVKDPDIPGQATLLVQCPNISFIPSLIYSPAINTYIPRDAFERLHTAFTSTMQLATEETLPRTPTTPPPTDTQLRIVYHFTPPQVASHPVYVQWMHSFPCDVVHSFLYPQTALTDAFFPTFEPSAASFQTTSTHAAAPSSPTTSIASPASIVDTFFAEKKQEPIFFLAQANLLVKKHLLAPHVFPLPQPLPQIAASLVEKYLPETLPEGAFHSHPIPGSTTAETYKRILSLAKDFPLPALAYTVLSVFPPTKETRRKYSLPEMPEIDDELLAHVASVPGAMGASKSASNPDHEATHEVSLASNGNAKDAENEQHGSTPRFPHFPLHTSFTSSVLASILPPAPPGLEALWRHLLNFRGGNTKPSLMVTSPPPEIDSCLHPLPPPPVSSSSSPNAMNSPASGSVDSDTSSPRMAFVPPPLAMTTMLPLVKSNQPHAGVTFEQALGPPDPVHAILPLLLSGEMHPHLRRTLHGLLDLYNPTNETSQKESSNNNANVTTTTSATGTLTSTAPSIVPVNAVPPFSSVFFTGTSSAVPGKHRNVSGALLFTPLPDSITTAAPDAASALERYLTPKRSIVLDCGEGTYGQIARRFGLAGAKWPALVTALATPSSERTPEQECLLTELPEDPVTGFRCAEQVLAGADLFWISHLHADHHLGLVRLLVEREQARNAAGAEPKPALVMGPTQMYLFLLEASLVDVRLIRSWKYIDAEYALHVPVSGMEEESLGALGEVGTNNGDPMQVDEELSNGSGVACAKHGCDSPTSSASALDATMVPLAIGTGRWQEHYNEAFVRLQQQTKLIEHAEHKLAEQLAKEFEGGHERAQSSGEQSASTFVTPDSDTDILAPGTTASLRRTAASERDAAGTPASDSTATGSDTIRSLSPSPKRRHLATGVKVEGSVVKAEAKEATKAANGRDAPDADASEVLGETESNGDSVISLGAVTLLHDLCEPSPSSTEVAHTYIPYLESDSVCAHRAMWSDIQATLEMCGIAAVRVVRVRHCYKAYGIRFDFLHRSHESSGDYQAWNASYSGDTRPCSEMVALLRGSLLHRPPPSSHPLPLYLNDQFAHKFYQSLSSQFSTSSSIDQLSSHSDLPSAARTLDQYLLSLAPTLMVHEATFEDADDGFTNAMQKRHATVLEATAVGDAGGVSHTLLTHFSARYPKMPLIQPPKEPASIKHSELEEHSAKEEEDARTMFVAYDLLWAQGGSRWKQMPKVLPALMDLFAKEEEEKEAH